MLRTFLVKCENKLFQLIHEGERVVSEFVLVNESTELTRLAAAIEKSPVIGIDLETTGLDPRRDRIRLLTVSIDDGFGSQIQSIVDCFAVSPTPLFPALAAKTLLAHNAAFDLSFLLRAGFTPGPVVDTMLQSQILYAGAHASGAAPIRHGLKDCCDREIKRAIAKELQKSNWSGALSREQLMYAAEDAAVLAPLADALNQKLAAADLQRTATIEFAALPCIVWMSQAGVQFDATRWSALATRADEEASRISAQLNAVAPPKTGTLFQDDWNWDSPEQVKEALSIAGCAVESTADRVLASLDHPLAALLRDYRDARKRATTYGDAWLKWIAADGRIYPRWIQLGANSGRMACTSPNMQNLPRGEYRNCIIAPPDKVLVSADYSQIELRIAAKLSNDEALLAAYRRGDDLHLLTAQKVLGLTEVTKEHRQLAKAVNFGLLYGMGARGFCDYAKVHYGIDLTEAQASRYRDAFFSAYPGLRRWHRSIGNGVCDTRTLTRRRVCGVERFNDKLNLPVQGTGADGLKLALARIWERRAECSNATPILAVHDEIVLEVPEQQTEPAAGWLKRCMIEACAPLIDPVPVDVEVKIGRTWGGT